MQDFELETFDRVMDVGWDIAPYLALAARVGGPILELGCGTGRVLGALHAEGHDVMGVERNPDRAARAAERVGQERVHLGDACAFRGARRFGLVIVPCNTVPLFQDPRPLLATASLHLRDGGLLAFDMVVPDGQAWSRPPHRWRREHPWLHGGTYDPRTRSVHSWWDQRGQRAERLTWYPPLASWPSVLDGAELDHLATLDGTGQPASGETRWAFLVARRRARHMNSVTGRVG